MGLISLSAAVAGCASIPKDRGAATSVQLVSERSPRNAGLTWTTAPEQVDAQVARVLSEPLDADDAVRIALLRNPTMRALYAELGIAQSELYDATRLSNPSLGYSRLTLGDHVKTTWSVSQNITELLFIGYRTKIERSRLLQAQQHVAHDVLRLEADVRARYYRYVAANSIAQLRAQAAAAATASAQYAQALFDAGNIGALQLSREQAAATQTGVAKMRADAQALEARSQLLTALAFPVNDERVQFVDRLELPEERLASTPALQTWAAQRRLDLAAARESQAALAKAATYASRWRWIGGVSVGVEREAEGDVLKGPTASVDVPLFNPGGGRALRAKAEWERSAARVAELELVIANEVAVRHANVATAQATVQSYRDKLVPLNERIVALTQERYSFMLAGAFELLSAKQASIDAYQEYIAAVRDYWLARVELLRAVGGQLPGESP